MPVKNGQGWSEYTPLKEKTIYDLFKQHLATVNAILNKNSFNNPKYIYIDATSGSGWNNGIKGSPLQFWDAVQSFKYPLCYQLNVYFIEKIKDNFNELCDNLSPKRQNNSVLINGEYTETIPEILKTNGSNYGILYIDPNGVIDFEFLEDIVSTRYMKVMDIILYSGATSIKRKRKAFKNIQQLAEYIRNINKKKWFVSEYYGSNQWAFFYGTNASKYKPKSSTMKFYDISSSFGERIFHKLNFTKKEYPNNLPGQRSIYESIECKGGN